MAKRDDKPTIEAQGQGKVLEADEREGAPETDADGKKLTNDEKIVEWVMNRVTRWKEHRDTNYNTQWNTYERQWRAIYSEEDKERKRERTKIMSPALSEAVENAVSEIEEAVFGRGDFFDVSAEAGDDETSKLITDHNSTTFHEDLAKSDFTGNCSEVVMAGGVYGTGIGEIVLCKHTERDIQAVQDPMTGQWKPNPVETEVERPALRSVSPRNFIIDPAARGIDDALGVAIEEDVGSHIVREGISKGYYKDVELETGAGDPETKPDPQVETPWMFDVVPIIRYYGKLPKHLLFPPEQTEDLFPDDPKTDEDDPKDADMVESWVVIAHGEKLLMAKETPDMMQDRPVVAYQWDIVPGRFWGRGICEKGSTTAKLLDAELRARMDALAFTAAPMMAMDATKLPRGFKFEVYPGKNLLLGGDPNTILKPFKFGELDANSGAQIQMLDQMVQRATGSVDTVALAQAGVGGQARSGAVSMSMSGIVKRNKRTLMRYVDKFLGPALRKLMWRYMQYDSPRYVPANMTFNVSSTMGIMQREYETNGLAQVMTAMQPGTSEHLLILMGLVQNSGIQGRDAILGALKVKLEKVQALESAPPVDPNAPQTMDPVMIEMQRMDAQLELATKQAKLAETQAKTRLLNAQAQSEMVAPTLESQKIALKGIYETPADRINAEFDRRYKLASLTLEKAGMESRERIADKQIVAAKANEPKTETVEVPVPQPVPVPIPVKQSVPVVVPSFTAPGR